MLPFEVATICLSTCVPIKKRHKRLYQPRNEEKNMFTRYMNVRQENQKGDTLF